MIKEDYIEMGFSENDAEFLEAYPRLYAIATTYGIDKNQIDNIFNKLDESIWIKTQTDHDRKQSRIKTILIRLDHLKQPLDLKLYKNYNENEIERLVGKYNTRFMLELMKVI